MKTPEEIKKGLSTCTQSGDCPNCPYETDCKEHAESVITYGWVNQL